MKTPLYINAYRELNRIIIRHNVINILGIINKKDIDLLNEIVKERIYKYPNKKEQIYSAALKELLAMVKIRMKIYEPPTKENYVYKTVVDFLKDDLFKGELAHMDFGQVARAIMRLDKFYKKYHSYLEETIETKRYIN